MEDLEAQRWPAAIAGQQRGGGRQPSPGTGADHGDAGRVDTERGRLVVQGAQRGVAVVQPGRVGMLGGEAVVDRDDHRAGVDGHHGRPDVLRLDAAHDEPAAVDQQDARPGCGAGPAALGPVDPHLHVGLALPPGNRAVVDVELLGLGQVARHLDEHRLEAGAGGHGVGQVELGHHLDECRELRIDHGNRRVTWAASGCLRRCGSTRRSCTSSTAARAPGRRTRWPGRAGAGRARPGPACP